MEQQEREEVWKPVMGWREYEVSDQGRVRWAVPARGTVVGRVLNPFLAVGYYYVTLHRGGTRKAIGVHRLVVEAFIGPLGKKGEGGLETQHKNGVKIDNRLENLERLTRSENMRHAYETELNDRKNHRGERSGTHRLTEEQVQSIRQMLADGETATAIARKFALGNSTVYAIKHRRSWAWLCDSPNASPHHHPGGITG